MKGKNSEIKPEFKERVKDYIGIQSKLLMGKPVKGRCKAGKKVVGFFIGLVYFKEIELADAGKTITFLDLTEGEKKVTLY